MVAAFCLRYSPEPVTGCEAAVGGVASGQAGGSVGRLRWSAGLYDRGAAPAAPSATPPCPAPT